MKDKINRLYEFGDPRNIDNKGQWPDYLQYGFTEDDISSLIELVIDPIFIKKPSSDNAVWTPLHAWRILGQLKSIDAINPLLDMLDSWVKIDDEWALSEIPMVIDMIGSAAIEPLVTYSKKSEHHEFSLSIVFEILKEIAITQPDFRVEVLAAYRQYMLKPDLTMHSLNGLIVSYLLDLNAAELIDEIRTMFHQDCVDITVAGDLEDIEIEFGLRIKRTTPKPHYGKLLGVFDETNNTSETIVQEKTKVGRNEPCPCGSGKKFKKCCLH